MGLDESGSVVADCALTVDILLFTCFTSAGMSVSRMMRELGIPLRMAACTVSTSGDSTSVILLYGIPAKPSVPATKCPTTSCRAATCCAATLACTAPACRRSSCLFYDFAILSWCSLQLRRSMLLQGGFITVKHSRARSLQVANFAKHFRVQEVGSCHHRAL